MPVWPFIFGKHNKLRRLLSSYIDGQLNENESKQIEEHLSTCQECRWDMDSLRATVGLLRDIPTPMPQKSFLLQKVPTPIEIRTPSFVWAVRYAASAAALLLVVLLAGDFTGLLSQSGETPAQQLAQELIQSPDSRPEMQSLSTPAPMPTAAPAPAISAPVAAPAEPIVPALDQESTGEGTVEETPLEPSSGTKSSQPEAKTNLSQEDSLNLPLWQLEAVLGGGVTILGGAYLWIVLRRRPYV